MTLSSKEQKIFEALGKLAAVTKQVKSRDDR